MSDLKITENRNRIIFRVESDDLNPEKKRIEDLDDDWQKLAEITFGENAENRIDSIKEFRRRISEEKLETIVQILIGKNSNDDDESMDLFCLKFLRAGGFNVETALDVLKNYLQNIKNNWNYFEKCTLPSSLEPIFDALIHTVLPHRDQFGRRVFVVRPGLWDTDSISFTDLFCSGYIICEMVAQETKTQIAGVMSVFDASNFGLKQLKNFTLENAKNLSNFVQGSFPIWFHDVHIINAPMFFKVAYQIIKPFLTERVRNSITFHSDLGSLHRSVDPKILPKEIGGSQGSFKNRAGFEAYKKMIDHFQNVKRFVESDNCKV